MASIDIPDLYEIKNDLAVYKDQLEDCIEYNKQTLLFDSSISDNDKLFVVSRNNKLTGFIYCKFINNPYSETPTIIITPLQHPNSCPLAGVGLVRCSLVVGIYLTSKFNISSFLFSGLAYSASRIFEMYCESSSIHLDSLKLTHCKIKNDTKTKVLNSFTSESLKDFLGSL